MPTIDQLDIKITSSTDSANKSIADLQSSLAKLNAAMSGMNTAGNTVVSAMNRMGNAVTKLQQGINSFNVSDVVSKLEEFSRGLNRIQISSNLGRNISNLAGGIKTLNSQLGGNFQGLASVGQALEPLSNIQTDDSVTKLVSAIKKLPEAMSKLNEADTGLFRQNVSQLTPALQELSTAVASGTEFTSFNKLISGIKKLPEAISKLNEVDVGVFSQKVSELTPALQELNTAAATANANLTGIGQNIRSVANATKSLSTSGGGNNGSSGGGLTRALGLGVSIVMLRRVAHGLANVIDLSNKYQEDLNLFTAALGKYAGEAKEYAETVSTAMGIDPAEWLRAQGVFQTLITGFGVVNDRAIVMSRNLTQLGYDLSSYFNISVSEAMTKLQSGISGELEPLRRLGFDLSEARLKALALTKGIDETYSKMTQAEKSQLRYEAIMNQVTVAQGDMARTLDAPANQLRILQAQVTQAGRALGNIFIPMLNAILPVATAVVKGIRAIADAIASLFGFTLTEVDYSGITDATDSTDSLSDSLSDATGSAKGLQKQLMKFDEINQFNDTSSGGGGGSSAAASGSQWEWELSDYDFLGTAINSKVDAVYSKIKPVVDWIIDNLTNVKGIALAVGAAFTGWVISNEILNGLRKVAGFGVQIKTLFAGIFTAGATVALTIHFEKEFLDTGKMTSFGKQILSTALGSTLAGALLSSVTSKLFPGISKGNAIALGSSVVLGVSGVATLFVAVDDAMEQGWNYKNIAETLTGYFETAMAGAVGFKALGKDAKSGFGLGLSVAGVATLGITAANVMEEGWTKENLIQGLMSTFSTVTGLALAAPAIPGVKATAGVGIGLAISGIVTMGVTAANNMGEGWTKESLISDLMGTFTTVTGFAVAASGIEGVTATEGAGVGLLASGVINVVMSVGELLSGDCDRLSGEGFISSLISMGEATIGATLAASAVGLDPSQGAGIGLFATASISIVGMAINAANEGFEIFNGIAAGEYALLAAVGATLATGSFTMGALALTASAAIYLLGLAIYYNKDGFDDKATKTAEELQSDAEAIFTNLTAKCSISLDPEIANVAETTEKFNTATAAYQNIIVGVEFPSQAELDAQYNALIEAANAVDAAEKAKLKAFIEIAPIGSLVSEDSNIASLLTGSQITSDLEEAGKGISAALQKGMSEGWTEGLTSLYNMYRTDMLLLTAGMTGNDAEAEATVQIQAIMKKLNTENYTRKDVIGVMENLKTYEGSARTSLGESYDQQLQEAYVQLIGYENLATKYKQESEKSGISDEERQHYLEQSAKYEQLAKALQTELETWDKDTWVNDAIERLFGDTYKDLIAMSIKGLDTFSWKGDAVAGYWKNTKDAAENDYEADGVKHVLNMILSGTKDGNAYKYMTELPENVYNQLAKYMGKDYLEKGLKELGIAFPGYTPPEDQTALKEMQTLINDYLKESGNGDSKTVSQTFVDTLKQLYDGDDSVIDKALEKLGIEVTNMDTAASGLTTTAETMQSAGNTIKSGANSFGSDVSEFDSTVSSMKKWIESKLAKNTPTNTGDGGSGGETVETHASGGYPASGSLFIAGEAGPELVGKIGNKTAVVNDEQIAMTLSRQMGGAGGIDEAALATAIVGALQSAGMGAVYLDGQQLARSINRETQRTGRSAIMI